jgi:type II secretory pathway pseudopilin PulG
VHLDSSQSQFKTSAFTFAEVCVAIVVCVIFAAAAFATNQRLLVALKNQKETAAASMMLQERIEKFRGFSYSNLADPTYVSTNVIQVPTTSEAPLSNLSEQITISGYMDNTGALAGGNSQNAWTRNSTYPTGNQTSSYATLATDFSLIQVSIVLTWTSKDGRSRTRSLTSVFGKGNLGP